MGYMRFHAFIVTSFGKGHLERAYETAKEIFPAVSEMIESPVNGYFSFFIPPDGSKEEWNESELGDAKRGQFRKWLISQLYNDTSSPFDWVEVQYGDDDGITKVIDSNSNYYHPKNDE